MYIFRQTILMMNSENTPKRASSIIIGGSNVELQ